MNAAKPFSQAYLFMAATMLTVCLAAPARAQGCSQCAEAVGQTPIRTQTAYRHAIAVLAVAGATVFGAGLAALRRFR